MRVNIYAEEITDRVEIVAKGEFTGLRFYLELPVTQHMDDGRGFIQHRGPFMHRRGDDDSSAVTFWGKRATIPLLEEGLRQLKDFYAQKEAAASALAASPISDAEVANRRAQAIVDDEKETGES